LLKVLLGSQPGVEVFNRSFEIDEFARANNQTFFAGKGRVSVLVWMRDGRVFAVIL
jgi:hypothetical protein